MEGFNITNDRLVEVITKFLSDIASWGTPADTGMDLGLLGEDGGSIDAIVVRYANNFRVYEVPKDSDRPVREHIPPSGLLESVLPEDMVDDEIDMWAARFSISDEDGTIQVSEVGEHVVVFLRRPEEMPTD